MSEFEEKARCIETILDRIKPIPENAPDDVKDAIDVERQMLVLQAGWNNMTADQLKAIINKK